MNDTIFFPDEPDADPVDDVFYKLRSPFSYTTLAALLIYVPEGFRTDLLSAPRFMWTLIGLPPDGLYRSAAVIHDFLYGNNGAVYGADVSVFPKIVFTRKQCDQILLEIMTRVKGDDGKGINWIQRRLTYLAVRLFGGTHWTIKAAAAKS